MKAFSLLVGLSLWTLASSIHPLHQTDDPDDGHIKPRDRTPKRKNRLIPLYARIDHVEWPKLLCYIDVHELPNHVKGVMKGHPLFISTKNCTPSDEQYIGKFKVGSFHRGTGDKDQFGTAYWYMRDKILEYTLLNGGLVTPLPPPGSEKNLILGNEKRKTVDEDEMKKKMLGKDAQSDRPADIPRTPFERLREEKAAAEEAKPADAESDQERDPSEL